MLKNTLCQHICSDDRLIIYMMMYDYANNKTNEGQVYKIMFLILNYYYLC